MTTKGRVVLRDILSMLKACAPGSTVEDNGPHKLRVKWNGKTYPSLPKGEHGKRPGRAEIQKGHVKDLVLFFGITDCAMEHLPVLRQ